MVMIWWYMSEMKLMVRMSFIDGVHVPLAHFLSLDEYCCNILCAHVFMSRLFSTELTVVCT